MAVITGSNHGEDLEGTGGNDIINAKDGADVIEDLEPIPVDWPAPKR
jgi:hypothetical protein